MARPPWFIVTTAIVLLAGCNSSSALLDESWELSPGVPAEVNLEMEANATIEATFQADQPVAWDVHSHGPGGEVTIHDNGTAPQATIRFTAPEAGGYSLSWAPTDGTRGLELTVTIEGQAAIVSVIP